MQKTSKLDILQTLLIVLTCIIVAGAALYIATGQPGANPISARGTSNWSSGHFSGDLTVLGTANFQAMTYTEQIWDGVTTYTATVNANAGIAVDTSAFTVADTTGNTVIAGTLTATGAAAFNGGITADTTAFTVADTSGNVRTAGTLAVAGASTLTGTVTTIGNATIGGFSILTAQTIIPADTKPITPTASMVLLNGAGNTTNTINACVTDGTLLRLVNIANFNVTIADSGNVNLTGQLVLAQWDSLSLVCASTVWIELATSNN